MHRLLAVCFVLAPLACSHGEPASSTDHRNTAPAVVPPAPAASPVALTLAPPAPPSVPAKGDSASDRNGPMPVVIMMMPSSNDDPARPVARTYKVSLAPDSETATIEVDERLVGTTRVQKLYPRERARAAVRVPSDAAVTRAAPARPSSADPQEAAARVVRRPAGPSPLSVATHQPDLNPNGAPIIE